MDYGVVWLKWKIGQILVGPKYFLPSLAKFFICNLERKHGWQSCSWSSYIFAHFFLMLDNVISLFHFFFSCFCPFVLVLFMVSLFFSFSNIAFLCIFSFRCNLFFPCLFLYIFACSISIFVLFFPTVLLKKYNNKDKKNIIGIMF